MIFEPLDLVARLAALVPPPRFNLVRYHGILAPSAALRPLIVPESEPCRPPDPTRHPGCAKENKNSAPDAEDANKKSQCRPRNYTWAELMKRVWSLDVLQCDRCGGRMRIVCDNHPTGAVGSILECLGLPARAPPIAAAASILDELPFELAESIARNW
jgi:hypothetical protein